MQRLRVDEIISLKTIANQEDKISAFILSTTMLPKSFD